MNRRLKKYILRTIIVSVICIFLIEFLLLKEGNALTQYISNDIENIDTIKYPGIKQIIKQMKQDHPNWNFKILYTGLDWNDVIQNEYKGHNNTPVNLIPSNSSTYNDKWICSICGNKTYDTGNWLCASDLAISYMMDVRNWLNSEDIFQFMELTYTGYNYDQVKNMVSGTFLDSTTHINTIIQAAQNYNINVYYIIARIIQEQGKNGNELVSGKGKDGQFVGYYNVFNIGATGNTRDEVILNGLKRAQKEGWTSLDKAIQGGCKIISVSYIAQGQNTLYLQKFDVENSDGSLYWHQYMQNLLAARNEGLKLTKAIKELGAIEQEHKFIIPIYENMPQFTVTEPNLQYEQLEELVKVNVETTLRIRSTPGGLQTLGWINGGTIVTRIEKALTKVNGTYWDKIKIDSETYGYVARQTFDTNSEFKMYLIPVEEIIEKDPEDEKDEIIEDNINNNRKLGDINGDGKISPTDYVMVKQHIMGVNLLKSEEQKIAADVNKDGKISPTDYVLIKNYIMHGGEL